MGDSAPAPPASFTPRLYGHTPPGGRPGAAGGTALSCVTRNRHLIGYCLSPDDLPALGVDMSHMAHPVSGAGRPC